MVFLVGCVSFTNPHRDPINIDNPSIDIYGEATSGVVGVTPDKLIILTPDAVEFYNALIKLYGNKLIPEVKKNDGIGKNKLILDNREYFTIQPYYFRRFGDMVIMYRNEQLLNKKD